MENFEKLGAFYLGREYDPAAGADTNKYLLYDSKDLLTHAVCVGMTGSGKTGLCISLLEEAAIDGVPAIIIDPKGDMANLFLTFPELKSEDFLPWINETEAAAAGKTPQEFAAGQAELWRSGLADWDQDGSRIAMLRDKTAFALYTPGSTAATPVSVLQQLIPDNPALDDDQEMMLEQISSTVSGLLSLLGLDADPVQSRDHILISNILIQAWQNNHSVDISSLIGQIQKPAIKRIGVIDLETFYPQKERQELAMKLNNLLASPKFASWLTGESLNIDKLLHDGTGKPKISIFSISHLSESERMFFVTLLLNQILSWTRRQSGTGSLRAILYMDEIFGFFPPVANPPSKAPLLTLLKQARAYGLGVVLTTQNPADLDYKGLSNTGTWFLGRLQTERDKARVLEGLEGAAASQGSGFDRAAMDKLLSGLGKRVFLMNNVHDREPTLFRTRWCLSYLRGPLTRNHLQLLTKMNIGQTGSDGAASESVTSVSQNVPISQAAPISKTPIEAPDASAAIAKKTVANTSSEINKSNGNVLPVLPTGIGQYVLPDAAADSYRPMLLGIAQAGYRDKTSGLNVTQDYELSVPMEDGVFVVNWDEASELDYSLDQLDQQLPAGSSALPLPEAARLSKSYTAWKRELTDWIYRNKTLQLYENTVLKLMSEPDESERDFQIRIQQAVRETRDDKLEDLRKKYTKRIQSLEEKIRKAEQAVEREKEQAKTQGLQTVISLGSTLLSAFLGKKAVSATTLGKATTAARGASRALKEQGDINRSKETVEAYSQQLQELEQEFRQETDNLAAALDEAAGNITERQLNPLKKDIMIRSLVILWVPAD